MTEKTVVLPRFGCTFQPAFNIVGLWLKPWSTSGCSYLISLEKHICPPSLVFFSVLPHNFSALWPHSSSSSYHWLLIPPNFLSFYCQNCIIILQLYIVAIWWFMSTCKLFYTFMRMEKVEIHLGEIHKFRNDWEMYKSMFDILPSCSTIFHVKSAMN